MSIKERVQAALRKSQLPDLRGLTVVQNHVGVVLEGYVSSFYHKQLAQELVRGSIGDAKLINDAQVVYHHEGD